MTTKLEIYEVLWSSIYNQSKPSIRPVPTPPLLTYYIVGSERKSNYLRLEYAGLIAVQPGIDPATILTANFMDVEITKCDRHTDLADTTIGQFVIWDDDWGAQRLRYFAATGQLYTQPITDHFKAFDGQPGHNVWKCVTITELTDLL